MSIDMFTVWLIVIFSTFTFQNYFTEKVTTWDIIYTYTTESRDYMAYGQDLVSSPGTALTWQTAQGYITNWLKKENTDNEEAIVVILAVNKSSYKRVFMPFWKSQL